MSKLNKILLVAVVILLVALGGVIYWQKSGSNYYAVYLNTGDLYFGKLSRFPKFSLKEVWFLGKESADSSFSLNQFSRAFWGPEDKLILDEASIVWMAPLKNDSQIISAMKNPQAAAAIGNGAPPATGQPIQSSPSPLQNLATSTVDSNKQSSQ